MNCPERPEARTAAEAITSRRSVRAFLPEPVPRETLRRILEIAGRAPSGSNIQPWHVDVLTGPALDRLTTAITDRFDAGDAGEETYQYYPTLWREPYLARRRETGWGLYSTLGIARGDAARMRAQHRRNFLFFDAPVGLIFSIDRDLPIGSWLDTGMFLQSIMIAARGFGLDTCPQQAFAAYHQTIREVLALPDDRTVICGMAMGHADPSDPANRFETGRRAVEDYTRFHD
ncbi:nitroreductase [Puniceibacterium confluentis]|uniref:nitroreductase n=1 Tax=Puniceibacterium confluentis TaxID=1958944 RepID=UPI0011B5C95C|nr:nitroreductase [Puniceibacterium confluentis]